MKETSNFVSLSKKTMTPNRVLTARVFTHLVMGAYTSSTQNSGLMLAIPQYTSLQRLLDTWNKRIIGELREESCQDLNKKLATLYDEMAADNYDLRYEIVYNRLR